MNKCAGFDQSTNKCKNGFMRIHPVCWGGDSGCPTCGHAKSMPDCMNEDLPAHLIPVKHK